MTNQEKLDEIDAYFDTHSKQEIYAAVYGDDYRHLSKFDRKLWEEVIDKQLEFDDEEFFYSGNPDLEKFKNADFLYLSNALLDLHNQSVDESDFPIIFYGVKQNNKSIIIATMIGQGAVTASCTLKGFKKWMEHCKNTYTIDESKFYTLDELEEKVKMVKAQYEHEVNSND